jgi:hypothetical protein
VGISIPPPIDAPRFGYVDTMNEGISTGRRDGLGGFAFAAEVDGVRAAEVVPPSPTCESNGCNACDDNGWCWPRNDPRLRSFSSTMRRHGAHLHKSAICCLVESA